jgi:hypothetical protein
MRQQISVRQATPQDPRGSARSVKIRVQAVDRNASKARDRNRIARCFLQMEHKSGSILEITTVTR